MSKHDNEYYTRKAEKAGCRIREGTNHTIVYPPEGQYTENEYPFMSIPRHDISPAVERKINRWLAALGILVVLIAAGVAFL